MKKLILASITLTAIGVAVKVLKENEHSGAIDKGTFSAENFQIDSQGTFHF